MDKFLKIAVVLTAYDQMTRVIKQATDDSTRRLKKLQTSSREAFGKGLAMTGLGVALAAPLIGATQKAIAFEDQMADVAKVMNLQIGSEKFKEVGNQALNLAVALRRPTEEASGLMAALAQGGVAAQNVAKVGLIAGKVGVAFGMASDLAGEKFIKMKNALGVSIEETKKVTDAINHLSDNTAAKAGEILTFMSQGGATVASTLNIAGEDIAAFGARLIAVGKTGAEAGTIMKKFQKGVLQNASMRKLFEGAGGGTEGLLAVLAKGKAAKDPFAFFSKFGMYGTAIAQMSQNLELTRDTLGKVSDEGTFLNSVQAEFTNRTSTNAGKIQAFKTQMERLAIIFGNQILPFVTKIIEKLGSLAERFASFAAAHPMFLKIAASIIGIVAATTIAIGVFNILKGVFLAYKVIIITIGNAQLFVAAKTGIVTAATWLWAAAMNAALWPVLAVIAAVAALAAGIYFLIKYWKDIVNWVKTSDNMFAKLIRFSLKPIVWLFKQIKEAWMNIKAAFKGGGIMDGIKQIGKSLLSFLLAPLEAILSVVNKVTKGKIGGDALAKIQNFRGSLAYSGAAGETAANAQAVAGAIDTNAPVTAENIAATQPAGAALELQAVGAGGGGTVGVNFNVQVTGDGNDIIQKLKAYEPELLRMIDEALARKSRKEY